MTEPHDPISELAASAISMHELYTAFVNAGFSQPEAFELIRSILIEGTKKGNP